MAGERVSSLLWVLVVSWCLVLVSLEEERGSAVDRGLGNVLPFKR